IQDIDHRDICLFADSVSVGNQGMYLSQITHYASLIDNVSLSAGMKPGFPAVGRVVNFFLHARFFKEFLADALHVEEVSVAVHSKCEMHSLVGKFCKRQGLGKIYLADLIETDV